MSYYVMSSLAACCCCCCCCCSRGGAGDGQVASGEGEKHADDGLEQRQLAVKSDVVRTSAADVQSTRRVKDETRSRTRNMGSEGHCVTLDKCCVSQ